MSAGEMVDVEPDGLDDELAEAPPEGAVMVGLWASGARCLLQYVVAPVLGVLGLWLPVIGLGVQVLGCVVTVAGAREVRRSRRSGWPLWVGLAAIVVGATAWALVSAIVDLAR